MRDRMMTEWLPGAYGLALGLALGAAVISNPNLWPQVVISACWMGIIEVGPLDALGPVDMRDIGPLP